MLQLVNFNEHIHWWHMSKIQLEKANWQTTWTRNNATKVRKRKEIMYMYARDCVIDFHFGPTFSNLFHSLSVSFSPSFSYSVHLWCAIDLQTNEFVFFFFFLKFLATFFSLLFWFSFWLRLVAVCHFLRDDFMSNVKNTATCVLCNTIRYRDVWRFLFSVYMLYMLWIAF